MNPIKLFSQTLLLSVLLLVFGGAQAAQPIDPERLEAFVAKGMELWNVPGMAVAVVSAEGTGFMQGFGVTSIDNGVPVNEPVPWRMTCSTAPISRMDSAPERPADP